MKGFGILLLIIGVVATFAAFSMDVSVVTDYGGRINNIGLMSDRQNYILISCFIILCGLLMVIFGGRKSSNSNTVKCPLCAELINSEAIKCKHCGSDLTKIEKINPKNKFNAINYDQRELFNILNGKNVLSEDKLAELVNKIKAENVGVMADSILEKQKFNIDTIESFLPKEIKKEFRNRIEYLILN